MRREEEDYRDAVNKALDFVNSFEKLSKDNQNRLFYEVLEAKGKLDLFKTFINNYSR